MDEEFTIVEMSEYGPIWAERALLWIEYLVRMEAYDRSLPGTWAHSVEGDMGNGDGKIWVVGRERLRDSVLNAQRHHRRALLALQTLLGHHPRINEEGAVMTIILERLPTHEARLAVLAGRSPTSELLGPDLLTDVLPKPN